MPSISIQDSNTQIPHEAFIIHDQKYSGVSVQHGFNLSNEHRLADRLDDKVGDPETLSGDDGLLVAQGGAQNDRDADNRLSMRSCRRNVNPSMFGIIGLVVIVQPQGLPDRRIRINETVANLFLPKPSDPQSTPG